MRHPRPFLLAATATLAVLALPAGAVTLTFDAIPEGPGQRPTSAVEQGVTIASSPSLEGLQWLGVPGTIHLDDGGTLIPPSVTFFTGDVFAAQAFEVIAGTLASYVDDGTNVFGVPYDNIKVRGSLDGGMVAAAAFSSGLEGGATRFSLGPAFAAIDALTITAVFPGGQEWEGLPIQCGDNPCGHFSLDSVTIAPVPLPPALPLAALGIGVLAALRLRRRD